MIWGSRTAIEVVVLAVVLSLLVGVPLGLISGYVGGRLDRVLVLIMDALFAFPYLLLAIVIAFLLSDTIGQGIFSAAIAITVVYIPQYFRVVRNHVICVREESYVEAARALGAPRRTIIGRYVFFNVIQNVPVIATLNAADAILTLAALGFLGYGIQPTEAAEWGYDLQPGDRRRRRRNLVDGAVSRDGDRAPGHRVHARRRGHQRHPQPADPRAADRPADDPAHADAGTPPGPRARRPGRDRSAGGAT